MVDKGKTDLLIISLHDHLTVIFVDIQLRLTQLSKVALDLRGHDLK